MSEIDITDSLVRTLVRDQYPQWADLPIEPVNPQGWDNRTFRLGEELSLRLPSGPGYVDAVEKENVALPVLAEHLSLSVPTPVALGKPGAGYPHPWSVRRWLPGETLTAAEEIDQAMVAHDLGAVLSALRKVPTEKGRVAGGHSYMRGCHPSAFGDQVQIALERLDGRVDTAACEAVWADAVGSVWTGAPVWFHGDVSPGNLLVTDGRLSAVIDFGTCGIGDPACDLVMAWTYFTGAQRGILREAAGLDDDAWRRARGWALWKALATMAGLSSPDPEHLQDRVLVQVLDDPVVD